MVPPLTEHHGQRQPLRFGCPVERVGDAQRYKKCPPEDESFVLSASSLTQLSVDGIKSYYFLGRHSGGCICLWDRLLCGPWNGGPGNAFRLRWQWSTGFWTTTNVGEPARPATSAVRGRFLRCLSGGFCPVRSN